jgi:hypothetical protein
MLHSNANEFITATPVSQGRKSKSATWDERVGEDSKTTLRNRLDKVMNLLKQKEQDARLAAGIHSIQSKTMLVSNITI